MKWKPNLYLYPQMTAASHPRQKVLLLRKHSRANIVAPAIVAAVVDAIVEVNDTQAVVGTAHRIN